MDAHNSQLCNKFFLLSRLKYFDNERLNEINGEEKSSIEDYR